MAVDRTESTVHRAVKSESGAERARGARVARRTALVVYATTDGHTEKIARRLAEAMRKRGCEAEVVDAAAARAPISSDDYDAIVVAASVHAGGYQRSVVRWLLANAAAVASKPSVFVSASLGVLQPDHGVQCKLLMIRRKLYARTGWRPDRELLVAGALPFTRYGWLKKRLMRRISRAAGGGTDIRRDYEYTDWTALEDFGAELAGRLSDGWRARAE